MTTELRPAASPLADDPHWQSALDWLLCCHANPESPQLLSELEAWLAGDERHRRAYHKALKLWQLSRLIAPPSIA